MRLAAEIYGKGERKMVNMSKRGRRKKDKENVK
jgi:hypothetical protein